MKIFLPILAVLLCGCVSGVQPRGDATTSQIIQASQPVSKISVTYTHEAQDELADNLRFDQNVLITNVTNALQARSLYNVTADNGETVEIQMTNIRIRSNFNAVMFGMMAGADKLEGEVYLRDHDGKVLNHFNVYATYGLGGVIGGLDSSRMGWLYDKFSQLLVQDLVGLQ